MSYFSCLYYKPFITKELYATQALEYTNSEIEKLSKHILSNYEILNKFGKSTKKK